jgi:acetolactate synthase I/II/III large subunit
MSTLASNPPPTALPADPQAGPPTVGDLVAAFLEHCGVRAAFGVISIHNMPMLDAIHRRGRIRFVSARGEAGAANMADACARVTGTLGVCITSTGTGAGNAAGALVEAMTAGTPLLHLTGQIDSPYLDRDLGFIHEHPNQLGMLAAVGKAAFRIRDADTALATLREAVRLAHTVPCGPVSVEIPIDVQAAFLNANQAAAVTSQAQAAPISVAPVQPDGALVEALAARLQQAQRPLLWLGGGARGAAAAVARLVAMGFGVVTSVQGRGVLAEDHPANLGAFNLQKSSAALYAQCDALLVVGSRLRSNETLKYTLALPATRLRIDANPLAEGRAYSSALFVHGDAALTLHALADALASLRQNPAAGPAPHRAWHHAVHTARNEAEAQVDASLGPYVALKNALNQAVQHQLGGDCVWVRDITLSNTMWGNRSLLLRHPRAGVHALGGGIGQGLAMGIGAAVATSAYPDKCPLSQKSRAQAAIKIIVLCGDGGFMLNLGELACAVQERANLLVILMNDGGYGVIKNIQEADYGSRHCYVDLHTPQFGQLCASMGVQHLHLHAPAQAEALLKQALAHTTPTVLEVDMQAWGPFAVKFAGPARKL